MKSIEMLGAAGGVTGSAHLLELNSGFKALIDCGMFQGTGQRMDMRNYSLNNHDSKLLNAVLVTHPHIDHIGRLPLLQGDSPIYMTPAAADVTSIAINNARQISPNLYMQKEIENMFGRIIRVGYNVEVPIDGASFVFRNAGHILGSASIEIQEKVGDKIVFSGDLGPNRSRTVCPPTLIDGADIVVMETTYGDRDHSKENPVEVILNAVKRIEKSKGTLLIPTFAIDRTQVVLSILRELRKNKKLGDIPVYLDSPMAIEVTTVYERHRELLNEELTELENPFSFHRLIKTGNWTESQKIPYKGPKIIIAGSGMMSGGRILRHAAEYLPDKKSVILFVGYPAEGTASRAIADGAEEVYIEGYGLVSVGATVLKTSSLSAHADKQQLFDWLSHINFGKKRLREVVLVHGDDGPREAFAHSIKSKLKIPSVSLPIDGETINFKPNAL